MIFNKKEFKTTKSMDSFSDHICDAIGPETKYANVHSGNILLT